MAHWAKIRFANCTVQSALSWTIPKKKRQNLETSCSILFSLRPATFNTSRKKTRTISCTLMISTMSTPFLLSITRSIMRKHLRYSSAFRYVLSHSRQLVETISPLSVPRFPLFSFSHTENATESTKIPPPGTFRSTPSEKPAFRTPISTFASQRTSVSTFLSRTVPSALCRTVLPYTPPNSPTVLYAADPLRFNFLSLNKQFNVSPVSLFH